jgi:hypothetical protein
MKLFLHWGVTSPRTEKNKKFFQHVVREGWNKILIFPFAQKDRDYQLQFELDSQKFIDHNPDVDIECAMASDDIEVLVEQIKEYRSLYFCGGITKHHTDIIKKILNYTDILSNKVISWNSAGSLMWAKYYYTQDFDEVRKGLGVLNIKMITHLWTDRYPNINEDMWLKKLENYKEDLPIYKIKEQEYELFEI